MLKVKQWLAVALLTVQNHAVYLKVQVPWARLVLAIIRVPGLVPLMQAVTVRATLLLSAVPLHHKRMALLEQVHWAKAVSTLEPLTA